MLGVQTGKWVHLDEAWNAGGIAAEVHTARAVRGSATESFNVMSMER
jgi:hypothetical protein